MQFTGWMYDIAREQAPSEAQLRELFARSGQAGYGAVGLYLEHRFAYASAPWATAADALKPESLRRALEARPPGLRVIPFLNTLGHMEGFIRAAGGEWLAEAESFGSLQICPTRGECVEFARGLVRDALQCFDDEWVHVGGDETRLLGKCSICAERATKIGIEGIYGEYFGDLCRWVLQQGRRPCLWGDMLLQHPNALRHIPRETILFDWQYTQRPRDTLRVFRDAGYDVVCCPSLRTYDAGWCFLDASRQNIDEHVEDGRSGGALGVLVTTWEASYFTNYESVLPLIFAAGLRMNSGSSWNEAIRACGGMKYAEAAEILGNAVPAAAPFLASGTWRRLRDTFVIRQNPFWLWKEWRGEACGEPGDRILELCTAARKLVGADSILEFPILLHETAVRWVRLIEQAHARYGANDLRHAADLIVSGGSEIARLRPHLERIAAAGGSAVDVARLERLVARVDVVAKRIMEAPRSGWRPAFEFIFHNACIPGDQAGWQAGPPPHYLQAIP